MQTEEQITLQEQLIIAVTKDLAEIANVLEGPPAWELSTPMRATLASRVMQNVATLRTLPPF